MAESVCQIATHTATDGYKWHYRRYAPSHSEPVGRVIYLHGIQSHGGWYEYSSRRLSEAGFEVFFLDRRGSGLNQLARGDTPSYQRLVDDVAEFLSTYATSPQIKTFVIGISWGGKLAVALSARHSDLFDGVALLCPGFFPKLTARTKRLSRFLGMVKLIMPTRRFAVPLSDSTLFTSNPRWLEFLREDSLALHRATARFLVASQDLDKALRHAPGQFHLPVLLMLAGQDRIIENPPTRMFVEQFATADREIIEYPEAHHTLEFEPDRDKFIDDLIRWLRAHIVSKT